jgi:hypothetical protein
MEFDQKELTQSMTALYGSALRLEMSVRTSQALELTDALWELVPIVVDSGQRYDFASPVDVADSVPVAGRLSLEVRQQIRAEADRWAESASAAVAGLSVDEAKLATIDAAHVAADPFGVVASLINVPDLMNALSNGFVGEQASMEELMYRAAYLRAVERTKRTPLLLRALFTTAVSTMEPYVNRMVQIVLQHANPLAYPTLADPALDKKVRDLMFGGPAKWRDALSIECGVTTVGDAVDWDRIIELWNDRNVIVHRGGFVDAKHSAQSGRDVGSVVTFEPSTVQNAIDDVGAARFAVGVCVWAHFDPDVATKLAVLGDLYSTGMQQSARWRQAAGLARLQRVLADTPQAAAAAQVNLWLALEQGYGPQHIAAEVESWQTADLPREFEMARQLLLGHHDTGLEQLADLVAAGAITFDDLIEWQLFDRLRDSQGFEALVRRRR